MKPDALLERIKAAPFRPFVLVTADGARFRVDHPEWIATVGGRTAVVMDRDERTYFIDVALVTTVEVDSPVVRVEDGARPESE